MIHILHFRPNLQVYFALPSFLRCLHAYFTLQSFLRCLRANQGRNQEIRTQFTPGSYTASAQGYNGEVSIEATFSETAITDIQVKEQKETAHVGDVAYPILIEDILAANGTGVDVVSGATFTSIGLKNAVNAAAEAASASDLDAFKKNTVEHTAQEEITGTWDVVIVGAGGAGLAAAVEAHEQGADNILVLEKMSFAGGSTTMAFGGFNCTNSRFMDEQGKEETPVMLVDKIVKNGAGFADVDMAGIIAMETPKVIEWLDGIWESEWGKIPLCRPALPDRRHNPGR